MELRMLRVTSPGVCSHGLSSRITRHALALIAMTGIGGPTATTVLAAPDPAAPPGEIQRPSARPLPEPEYEREVPPALRLPPVPAEPEGPGVPGGLRVLVNDFELTGNTVFSDAELGEVTAPYEGRYITSEELEEVRYALTRYYVDRGYINSGTLIPDQEVVDGVIRLEIVEGRLTEIRIIGNERLRTDYIKDRLALGAGPPLNVGELQERIQILLDGPLIERVNAELGPGDRRGEAELLARIHEGRPYQVAFILDNRLSPSVGEVEGLLQGTWYAPTGRGDVLSAGVGYADGLSDYSLDYAVPLDARDTTLEAYVDHSESDVIEEPFADLDISSETDTLGFRINRFLYRTPRKHLTMSLGLEKRSSQTFLLGQPFSFSPGVPADGESDVTVIRWGQEWLERRSDQVIAVRSTFSFGIDVFDATINDDLPDGEFVAWLGQFQWAKRLSDRGDQIIFRTDVQLADGGLLPLEQFAVGGATSVRGYRENQLVRDQGYVASLEYRYPLRQDQAGRSTLQLAAFVDVGGADFKDRDTPSPDSLESIGLGLRWDPSRRVHAELYWGHGLTDVDNPNDDSLQDDGIHFFLRANLFD